MITKIASLAQAPLEHVRASNETTYAYRRIGEGGDGPPLVFLQHFRGNIDNWDPALIDPIAAQREVILFDNAGVGASTGVTPVTVEQMAEDAVAFLDVLHLTQVDLFGFSIGGFIAQHLALSRPGRVRRLILAGTGPKGAPGMGAWRDDVIDGLVADQIGPEGVLHVFYTPTPAGQAAGKAASARIRERRDDRDELPTIESKNAQYQAVLDWGVRDWDVVFRLSEITQPTLILQGDSDIMIPASASYLMAGVIPDARITVYPDASHGSIFQYADDAARRTLSFLSDGAAV